MLHYQRDHRGKPVNLPDALTCPSCLVEFKPKIATQRYCTRKCSASRNSRRSRGYLAPVPRVRNCEYCGEIFTRPTGRGNPLYCSTQCAKVAVSIRSHMRDYGMTKTQYREMLTAQGGACAICHQPEAQRRKSVLSVDHDHGSGLVRGLLCHACNVAIGYFSDDPERLRAAADYIERYRPPSEDTHAVPGA
jgi:hypothetical protein